MGIRCVGANSYLVGGGCIALVSLIPVDRSCWASTGPVCRHGRLRPGPELVLELSLIAPGGLNSIYTDVDAQAGDTIVVDLPYPCLDDLKGNVAKYDLSSTHGSVHQSRNWGFAMCATKKGVPKVDCVIVCLCDSPTCIHWCVRCRRNRHSWCGPFRLCQRILRRMSMPNNCVCGSGSVSVDR